MFSCLTLQAVMLVVLALLAGTWWSWTAALAFSFGGSVALLNSGLLAWRWYRGLVVYHCDGSRHLKSFNRSAMERFFVVGSMLAMGFAWLDLAPLPLLTGFIAGQVAWVIAAAVHQIV